MNKILTKLLCVCLALAALFLTACREEKADEGESTPETTEEVRAEYCRINGEDLYFLADDELETLREPLVKLLSNQEQWIDSGDFSIGYYHEIPDPDQPYIEYGDYCGLFDVTGDGMPELLVEPYGFTGSSGGRTWYAYDIYSGEKIGEIGGGFGDIWCSYYYREDGRIYPICRYMTQCGWGSLDVRVSTIKYYEEYGQYYSVSCFNADQFVVTVKGDLGVEDYIESRYYVFGERVDMADYFYANSKFDSTCVRIPETELIIIDWDDVSSEEDDRFVRADKMAEALLTSNQKFILPE